MQGLVKYVRGCPGKNMIFSEKLNMQGLVKYVRGCPGSLQEVRPGRPGPLCIPVIAVLMCIPVVAKGGSRKAFQESGPLVQYAARVDVR